MDSTVGVQLTHPTVEHSGTVDSRGRERTVQRRGYSERPHPIGLVPRKEGTWPDPDMASVISLGL